MKVPLPAHFDLADADAYARWREEKLARHPRRLEELMVELRDPRRITAVEREAILRACARANMAVYAGACGADPDKDIPRRLAAAIGLRRLDANYLADDDGITPLAVAQAGTRSGYIPYTNRGIRWHTDGYYNEFGREIRGMVLHCVMSASAGGENRLLDHEIAYILLRDRDPEFIAALMANDAMTIPARIEDVGGASREQGPRAAGMRPPASAAEPPTARGSIIDAGKGGGGASREQGPRAAGMRPPASAAEPPTARGSIIDAGKGGGGASREQGPRAAGMRPPASAAEPPTARGSIIDAGKGGGGASREQGPRAAGMRPPASAAEPPTARGSIIDAGKGGGGASREHRPRAAGMRAPANAAEPPTARAACTGPVFSVGPGGRLHMRYTARTRSIAWKEDERTRAAVAALEEILEADSPWVFRGRLEPGMGLACNNVLHDRAPFSDTPERRRLLYRARYFDRVAEPSC